MIQTTQSFPGRRGLCGLQPDHGRWHEHQVAGLPLALHRLRPDVERAAADQRQRRPDQPGRDAGDRSARRYASTSPGGGSPRTAPTTRSWLPGRCDQGRKWDPPGQGAPLPPRQEERAQQGGPREEVHPARRADGPGVARSADPTRSDAALPHERLPDDDGGRRRPRLRRLGGARIRPEPGSRRRRRAHPRRDIDRRRRLVGAADGGQHTPSPGTRSCRRSTFAGGKLMLAYYDFRDDVSRRLPQVRRRGVGRRPAPASRHTVDVRAAMAVARTVADVRRRRCACRST